VFRKSQSEEQNTESYGRDWLELDGEYDVARDLGLGCGKRRKEVGLLLRKLFEQMRHVVPLCLNSMPISMHQGSVIAEMTPDSEPR